MRFIRSLTLVSIAVVLAALSGCAGHRELKAPCAAGLRNAFSSAAYAAGTASPCGPLVRQQSVTLL